MRNYFIRITLDINLMMRALFDTGQKISGNEIDEHKFIVLPIQSA